MKVLVSISVLVILALGVGALPAREEVPVDTTKETRIYRRHPDKWSALENDERLWLLEAIEQEVGSPVGSIFITLGAPDAPYHLPPPLPSPPLHNISIRRDSTEQSSDATPVKGESTTYPSNTPEQRIPGFVCYNGVPMLVPKAFGKIPIKIEVIKRMIAQRELDM